MSSRNLVVTIIVATLVMWGVAFVRHKKLKPGLAQTELQTQFPDIYDRINQAITNLKRETTAESMAKLSDVNLFYWPGPSLSRMEGRLVDVSKVIPLPEEIGRYDLEAIMSNRRFRKTFAELSKMDKAAASELFRRELTAAITEYLPLYDAEIDPSITSRYTLDKIAGKKDYTLGAFVISTRDMKVVIAGARLKVLALVWTSGLLRLTSCRDQIERVARVGVKQRSDLYDDLTLHPSFKSHVLERASLYNRQIIISGLLGVAADGRLEATLLKPAGLEWRERKLTVYTAALTESDLPVWSGGMNPDYSRGSLTLKYMGPLNDASFDKVLRELHLMP